MDPITHPIFFLALLALAFFGGLAAGRDQGAERLRAEIRRLRRELADERAKPLDGSGNA